MLSLLVSSTQGSEKLRFPPSRTPNRFLFAIAKSLSFVRVVDPMCLGGTLIIRSNDTSSVDELRYENKK